MLAIIISVNIIITQQKQSLHIKHLSKLCSQADVEEKQALLIEASLARHTWWVTLLAQRMDLYFLVVDDDADHDVVVVM